jgi:hypothetical protein
MLSPRERSTPFAETLQTQPHAAGSIGVLLYRYRSAVGQKSFMALVMRAVIARQRQTVTKRGNYGSSQGTRLGNMAG